MGQAFANASYLMDGYRRLAQLERHDCNLCGYSGRFWPFGDPPRPGAVCARCDSKERHRLIGLWLASDREALQGARVLHFAPEPVLTRMFKQRAADYQSADLNPKVADTVLNIESIDLPSESVDVVVASHVLEHVNDEKALSEIRRALVSGGRAVLMFPIIEGWTHTYENGQCISHADRRTYFGQFDHVRMYGADVRDRIRAAGFTLDEFTAEEPDVTQYGLVRGEKIFIATKA